MLEGKVKLVFYLCIFKDTLAKEKEGYLPD